jgi:hypothetical protein
MLRKLSSVLYHRGSGQVCKAALEQVGLTYLLQWGSRGTWPAPWQLACGSRRAPWHVVHMLPVFIVSRVPLAHASTGTGGMSRKMKTDV